MEPGMGWREEGSAPTASVDQIRHGERQCGQLPTPVRRVTVLKCE